MPRRVRVTYLQSYCGFMCEESGALSLIPVPKADKMMHRKCEPRLQLWPSSFMGPRPRTAA